MDDKLRPGYQTKKELYTVKQERIERYINNYVVPFVHVRHTDNCLDVGELNPRGIYLAKQLGVEMDNWDADDLNFDPIDEGRYNYYDAIFALDVLEHIQNLLFCVRELKKALKPDGSLYVNMPNNIRPLWGKEHYHELTPEHFIKWICNPLGLRVVRQKNIKFIANWKAFFIGVRPVLRILRGESTWRGMARSMFCWNFYIIELKKDI